MEGIFQDLSALSNEDLVKQIEKSKTEGTFNHSNPAFCELWRRSEKLIEGAIGRIFRDDPLRLQYVKLDIYIALPDKIHQQQVREPIENWKAWLYRVSTRAATDEWRKWRHEEEVFGKLKLGKPRKSEDMADEDEYVDEFCTPVSEDAGSLYSLYRSAGLIAAKEFSPPDKILERKERKQIANKVLRSFLPRYAARGKREYDGARAIMLWLSGMKTSGRGGIAQQLNRSSRDAFRLREEVIEALRAKLEEHGIHKGDI